MRDLEFSLRNLILICLIGFFVFGVIIGMLAGEYMEMKYINDQINNSAQPGHVIKNEHGFFIVERFNESCYTVECVSNFTIIKGE